MTFTSIRAALAELASIRAALDDLDFDDWCVIGDRVVVVAVVVGLAAMVALAFAGASTP